MNENARGASGLSVPSVWLSVAPAHPKKIQLTAMAAVDLVSSQGPKPTVSAAIQGALTAKQRCE